MSHGKSNGTPIPANTSISALSNSINWTCPHFAPPFAWYGHLKDLKDRPWLVAALVSWCIAFFEYMIQVPANRIGNEVMNLGQLKILQEVIALTVFIPFVLLYSKEKLTLDYLWASLCLLGAAFFVFRSKLMGS